MTHFWLAVRGLLLCIGVGGTCPVDAQSLPAAGLWRYTIATRLSELPEEHRANFPLIKFEVCRSAEDFNSGAAYTLQTTAGSGSRCASSLNSKPRDGGSVAFSFQCDGGASLVGSGVAYLSARALRVELVSEPRPPFPGIEKLNQTMRASFVGPCTPKAESPDLLQTQ